MELLWRWKTPLISVCEMPFLKPCLLVPFSLLCFHVPLMVLALLPLLLSLLLCLDESEDLWVVLKLFSLDGVDDTNCSWQWCHWFLFYFIFVHTHIHTQIPPSPATGLTKRRFYEVAAVVAVKECSGAVCIHACPWGTSEVSLFPHCQRYPSFKGSLLWNGAEVLLFQAKNREKAKELCFCVVDLHLH